MLNIIKKLMDAVHNFLSTLKGQLHYFIDTKGVLLGGTPFMLMDTLSRKR
jgi:hypothetical protein